MSRWLFVPAPVASRPNPPGFGSTLALWLDTRNLDGANNAGVAWDTELATIAQLGTAAAATWAKTNAGLVCREGGGRPYLEQTGSCRYTAALDAPAAPPWSMWWYGRTGTHSTSAFAVSGNYIRDTVLTRPNLIVANGAFKMESAASGDGPTTPNNTILEDTDYIAGATLVAANDARLRIALGSGAGTYLDTVVGSSNLSGGWVQTPRNTTPNPRVYQALIHVGTPPPDDEIVDWLQAYG